ncbi:NAD-dependent epimerase/dehydratase family protein [Streptomonospora wellingtoniae]|uniref:NAD-dependent epimerase/dehydratase family protein n=1 Tax=Streptomonospora wellingtoniae TaxID=3075544 RepID=A0ABU2KT63_9ACTN|nr:NAD-dependent epimerase/dehydratase family protein [Streptomonospora sp. DSM 45055]MDT0302457.1 NAD-dependent epimerase/dehydratase family protein [Streptomonospora sp. DSM 45055]
MSLHVIVGAGPLGTALARHLADSGEEVRVVTRSGGGPDHPRVERVRADATDAAELSRLARGAAALYNCANPPSYDTWEQHWPPLAASLMEAAELTGAVLAIGGCLYGYGPVEGPMHRDLPLAATDRKGRIRARIWQDALARHEQGALRVTEVRASDYIGTLNPTASYPELYAEQVRTKRRVFTFGDPDQVHSVTYIPDMARTLAAAAVDERAWGHPWHVPSPPAGTVRDLAADMAGEFGVAVPGVVKIPRPLLRTAFPFSPFLREMGELLYQWDFPYVIDAAATTEAFGVEATPWQEIVRSTAEGLSARAAAVSAGS